MMISAQVVETSVNVTLNSPSQDYTHSDDRTPLSYDMIPGFKPFTIFTNNLDDFFTSGNIVSDVSCSDLPGPDP